MIAEEARRAVRELAEAPGNGLRPVGLLVIGCSTSEVTGGTIGHASAPETGRELAGAILQQAKALHIRTAFQCCEHLNRALVVERETAEKYGLCEVCAVPYPKAGGSCASAAWRLMQDPVLVESIQADAGLDIGGTLIGMHLKSVAVPVRLSLDKIGCAHLLCARTRPKLIGGERARYTLE